MRKLGKTLSSMACSIATFLNLRKPRTDSGERPSSSCLQARTQRVSKQPTRSLRHWKFPDTCQATTLEAITYHLLANPYVLLKLKLELEAAIPDASIAPTCTQVESLPYLTAVIQEGIRLHPGATLRMQRVSPVDDLVYVDETRRKTWLIPASTPVSMTPTLIQTQSQYFPEPMEFRPERWIENPRLDKYILSFSKGTRNCLGYDPFHAPIPPF